MLFFSHQVVFDYCDPMDCILPDLSSSCSREQLEWDAYPYLGPTRKSIEPLTLAAGRIPLTKPPGKITLIMQLYRIFKSLKPTNVKKY